MPISCIASLTLSLSSETVDKFVWASVMLVSTSFILSSLMPKVKSVLLALLKSVFAFSILVLMAFIFWLSLSENPPISERAFSCSFNLFITFSKVAFVVEAPSSKVLYVSISSWVMLLVSISLASDADS